MEILDHNASQISLIDINTNYSYPEVDIILKRCEQMVKGVCFEIIIRQSRGEEKQRYLIDIDPEDIQFVRDVDENQETFEQRLNRIENLQGIYIELWTKTTEKLEQCKKKFKNTDYKIVLLKRKSDQISKKNKSLSPNDKSTHRYSAASTILIDDNKSSSDADRSEDEPSSSAKRQRKDEYPKISSSSNLEIIIGPNGTQMHRNDFELVNWADAASSTRKLLTLLFGDKVLATHSLTGNQSPAFRGRERAPKSKLDPFKIADIIYIVTLRCKVSPQIVRAAITTKCADASKKIRRMGMKI